MSFSSVDLLSFLFQWRKLCLEMKMNECLYRLYVLTLWFTFPSVVSEGSSVCLPSYMLPVWSSAGSPSDTPPPALSAPELPLLPDTAWKSEHKHTPTHTHGHFSHASVDLCYFNFHTEMLSNTDLSAAMKCFTQSQITSHDHLHIRGISFMNLHLARSMCVNSTTFHVWQNEFWV